MIYNPLNKRVIYIIVLFLFLFMQIYAYAKSCGKLGANNRSTGRRLCRQDGCALVYGMGPKNASNRWCFLLASMQAVQVT